MTDLQTRLVAHVSEYALRNYGRGGWDYVVECWTTQDILECIGDARTERGARRAVRAAVKPVAERRAEVLAEVF